MLILDTCAIIWDCLDPSKLSVKAVAEIALHRKKGLYICDISLWEIAMLIKHERLKVACTFSELIKLGISEKGYRVVSISPEIAQCSVGLPGSINKDPADRLITATAITNGCKFITADKNLRKSNRAPTIW